MKVVGSNPPGEERAHSAGPAMLEKECRMLKMTVWTPDLQIIVSPGRDVKRKRNDLVAVRKES